MLVIIPQTSFHCFFHNSGLLLMPGIIQLLTLITQQFLACLEGMYTVSSCCIVNVRLIFYSIDVVPIKLLDV